MNEKFDSEIFNKLIKGAQKTWKQLEKFQNSELSIKINNEAKNSNIREN
jgi:hypothetical protein